MYVAFYCVFSDRCEAYFCTYLLAYFVISFPLLYFLKNKLLQPVALYIPIALIGVVESVVSLLQYLHIFSSHSPFFAVTGTPDNPNIAAMAITLSIPSCIGIVRLLKKPYRYVAVLAGFVIVASLIILQCRTALIGTAVIVVTYWVGYRSVSSIKIKRLYRVSILIGFALLISSVFYLQNRKQASSDGRLTIWKVSAEMIARKPFTGHGYGLFQREYNMQQADYFNREKRPEAERMNAGYTAMAYNEYLEQTVMGGIPGGLLFMAVIAGLLWSGWKNRAENPAPFAGIAAFAVMSLFNFTVESPMLFFAFIVYATLILARERSSISPKTYVFPRRLAMGCSLVGIAFILVSLQKYGAQKELKIARDMIKCGEYTRADKLLKEIEPDISTSEAFYRTKADLLAGKKQYAEARVAIDQALQYTSSTTQLLISARLSEKIGDYAEAEQRYKTVCGMEPHLFRPRAMLMRMYSQSGQNSKARIVAQEILRLKPKIDSKEVRKYKQEAKKMIGEEAPPRPSPKGRG